MEKLEILQQFIKKYGSNINPDLNSVKYCQNTDKAIVILSFISNNDIVQIDLDFIGGDFVQDDEGNDKGIIPMFDPQADIVDNARTLLDLDAYSLIMCIDHLFTEAAASRINNEYNNANKNFEGPIA